MYKIVAIDDDEAVCRTVKTMLEAAGKYEVHSTTEPDAAKALIKDVSPDVIILDVMMPQIDGITFLKGLKESQETCQIPVIMLTGDESDETMHEAIHFYAEAYVTKPASRKELETKVSFVLKIRGKE